MILINKDPSKKVNHSEFYYLKSVKLELIKILIITQLILDAIIIVHSFANDSNYYAIIGQLMTVFVMLVAALLLHLKVKVNVISLILCLYYSLIVVPSVCMAIGTSHPLPILIALYTAIIIILLLEGKTRLLVLGIYLIISTIISAIDIIDLSHTTTLNDAITHSFSLYLLYSLISVTVWVFKSRFLKLSEAIFKSSLTDHLTGAYNIKMLDRILEKHEENDPKGQGDFAVALIDMDNFKSINDTYGHKQGDQILIDFVKHANKFIRSGDLLCRYGGDEFVILFSRCDKKTAYDIVSRLLDETHNIDTITEISFSAGIADFQEAQRLNQDILKIADQRMYAAKKKGKNSVALSE